LAFGVLTTTASSAAAQGRSPSWESSAPRSTDAVAPSPSKPPSPEEPRPLLPLLLRVPRSADTLRVDSTFGFGELGDKPVRSSLLLLSGSHRITESFALNARWGVHDYVEMGGAERAATTNPTVGGLLAWRLGRFFRVATAASVALPIGSGSGSSASTTLRNANRSAGFARSAYDGALFAVNDLGVPVGADLAFAYRRFSAQAEVNVIPSVRVQGARTSPDPSRLNSTSGLLLGYAFLPELELATELRYQRFLSTPVAVEKDPTQRDSLTVAAGLRTQLVTGSTRIRPGLSYSRGIAGAIAANHYQMVGFDIPVAF